MENYYKLEYEDVDGNKFLIVSESQMHISYMTEMIAHIEDVKSDKEIQYYPLEKKKDFVKEIYSFLGASDALDALSIIQIQQNIIDTRESDTPPQFSIAIWDVLALLSLVSDSDANCQGGELDIDRLRIALYEVIQESYFNAFESMARDSDSKNKISESLKSHEASVRGRQYQSISSEINEAIINKFSIQKYWKKIFGFTYNDVLLVREAAHEATYRKLKTTFDSLNEIREISDNFSAVDLSSEEKIRAEKAFSSAFPNSPSEYHEFSSQEISMLSHLSVDTVRRILSIFSVGRTELTSEEVLQKYVDGFNPLRRKNILRIDEDSWYLIAEGILLDEIIKVSEAEIKKDLKEWSKYSKARDKLFEDFVCDTFKLILGSEARFYPSFKYKNPGKNNEFDLSKNSQDHLKTDSTECDLLCVIDGIAICVEIKAGGIREPGREGDKNKLFTDLEKTIAGASRQAQRLKNLLKYNGGVWDKDGNWRDFSEIKEIHQIVVCLEDLNSISPTLSTLVDSGIIQNENLPWVVSVSDLLVFSKLIQRPVHFIRYLRSRVSAEAVKFITAQDELDLLMWFIYGGLFFHPNPQRKYELDNSLLPPTKKDIRIYNSQSKVFIHTLTGELDSFMYHSEDPVRYPVSKIEIIDQPLTSIIEQVESLKGEGWLRLTATLGSLSSEAQGNVLNKLNEASIRSMQRRGGVDFSFASWGYDHNVIFCFMVGIPRSYLFDYFKEYVEIKKHWMRVRSAFGILLDPNLKVVETLLLEYPYQENPELDREARRRGCVPLSVIPRCSPPAAKKKKRRKR